VLVAVVATVLAAVVPALAASRVPPVAALGTAADGESGAPLPARRLVGTGGLVVAAAALAGLAGGLDAELALIVLAASGMTVFAAVVAAGPLLVRALAATLGRPVAALGGPAGRLAVANALQVPRRIAATVSVLALGVGLTSALLVGLASTDADAQRSLAEQFPAEVAVTGAPAAVLDASPQLVVVGADDGTVHVDPAPGVDGAAVRDAIGTALAGRPGVLVEYAGDARAELESVLLTLRIIGLGLVGMTLLVAVVGVAVTLLLSVTERTRETGLLRAVGLTRPGVRRMVAWEAALAGSGAAVLGAAVGALYGVLGLRALDVGVGFVPDAVPALALLVTGVVAVAVLAAVGPAVRAGRVPPVRALTGP
jgi:putative ABC transport system permease protein